MSGGSELGGEEEVFDLGGSGIVEGEDEEDVDDELEDVEDIDDEDDEDELEDDEDDEEVAVEVSDVVDNGSGTSRCYRCSSSVFGGEVIVVLESVVWADAVSC